MQDGQIDTWQAFALIVVGGAALAGLVIQFGVSAELARAQGHGTVWALLRMLAYFTVLTNLAVVAYSAVALYLRAMFPALAGGVALAIGFVGIIYAVLLRHLQSLHGVALVADTLLHTVTPIVFFLFWLACVPKRRLRWRYAAWWMLYPLAYLAYALARGAFEGFYPYPFIDVAQFGYARVAGNVVGLIVAWWLGAAIMLGMDRIRWHARAD